MDEEEDEEQDGSRQLPKGSCGKGIIQLCVDVVVSLSDKSSMLSLESEYEYDDDVCGFGYVCTGNEWARKLLLLLEGVAGDISPSNDCNSSPPPSMSPYLPDENER